jgi:hypothetical protein
MASDGRIRNPDSNPTKVSGFWCCPTARRGIRPNIPLFWRDYTTSRLMSLNESIVEDAALEWFGELR